MTSVAVQAANRVTELRRLVDQGKDRGFITYDEINISLAQDDLDTTQVEYLLEIFAQEGIEIVYKIASTKNYTPSLTVEELPAEAVVKEVEAHDHEEVASFEGLPLDDSVRAWLREIGKTPLLSMDEEMILAQQIERDYEDPISAKIAKDRLTQANLRLVVSIAKRYSGPGMSFPD